MTSIMAVGLVHMLPLSGLSRTHADDNNEKCYCQCRSKRFYTIVLIKVELGFWWVVVIVRRLPILRLIVDTQKTRLLLVFRTYRHLMVAHSNIHGRAPELCVCVWFYGYSTHLLK